MIYKCPICGGSYTSSVAAKRCLDKCAGEQWEKQEKDAVAQAQLAERLKRQAVEQDKKRRIDEVGRLRKSIESKYNEIKPLVKQYNDACAALYDKHRVLTSFCSTECSFASDEELKFAKELIDVVNKAIEQETPTVPKNDDEDLHLFLKNRLGF